MSCNKQFMLIRRTKCDLLLKKFKIRGKSLFCSYFTAKQYFTVVQEQSRRYFQIS